MVTPPRDVSNREGIAGAAPEETSDYETLVAFFIENGLEFSAEDAVPTDLVKCWAIWEPASDGSGRAPLGACVLARREGEYIIDGIAVAPALRERGAGKTLLAAAVAEARARGGKTLCLVARAPDFFRKQGFTAVPRETAPNFFECAACPQYDVSCFPEVMRLAL